VRTNCRKLAACAVLPVAVLAATPAAAQDILDLAQACRDDYRRLCSGVQPGGGAILACLSQHAAALSRRCREAVAGLGDGPGKGLGEGPGADSAGGVELPQDVSIVRDVAYGPSPNQRLDVYRPADPRGAPVLFIVHGGAWVVGDKASANLLANKLAHWVPRGYILVSANYRLLPEADPIAQADDVAKALATAQAKARTWGGDPSRFVLMGHSAGAHLVALLAADPSIAARQGGKPWLGTIALDSAAYDVTEIMRRPHLPLYDRAFGQDPRLWQKASPLHRLAGAPAPMLLVCSSRRLVACAQAQGFADKATSMGGRATVLPVDMTHAEINRNLGVQGLYTAAVDAFLKSLGLP
jgi:acetyl esterase/lipase